MVPVLVHAYSEGHLVVRVPMYGVSVVVPSEFEPPVTGIVDEGAGRDALAKALAALDAARPFLDEAIHAQQT